MRKLARVLEWLADGTFAARRLRRTPVFTAAAITLLGVGMAIAAATASLVNVAWFKRPAAEQGLVHVGIYSYMTGLPGEVVDAVLSDPPASFTQLAGFGVTQNTAVVAEGVSRRAAVEAVTGPYFTLFNAVPSAGRLIQETDARDNAMVAVISDRFLRATFDGSADAMGATMAVGGKRLTIVGVVDKPVRSGIAADVWVPSHVLPVNTLFGRLAPDVTIEQATAEVAARYGPFEVGGAPPRLIVREGLTAPLSPRAHGHLIWFIGLALTISLVASVSFGLLLFARMASSQSDMAVRIALGATARDLTRLLAFEVVLIAVAATFLAIITGSLLARFAVGQFGATIDASPDWRVFFFVATATLAVALAVVARLSWSVARIEALGSMVATGGMGGATIRTADTSFRLVIAQSAATAALLLLAALIARSALPSRTFTHGLDINGAAIAWIDQSGRARSSETGTREARSVLNAAAEIPGVRHAALISSLPGTDPARPGDMATSRSIARPNLERADVRYVSAAAFDALGLVVTQGRTFTTREDENAEPVAVVSRTAALRFWPDLEPVGHRLWIDRGESRIEALVIGVVSDAEVHPDRRQREPRDVYLPIAHRPEPAGIAILARSDQDAGVLAERLRASLQQAAPDIGLLSVTSLGQYFYERYAPPLFVPRILGVLGLLVFIVAIGGLYGLMSYLATMRRREIGIRKALGATTAALCRMLARENSRMLVAGVALGIVGGLVVGSIFLGRTNVRLFDPAAMLAVAGFLYVAGLSCAILPFVRMMRERTVSLREP